MRRVDEPPIDPEIAASLDAIDATLAGEPVDPRHAELAELALLLASQRPQIDAGFAGSLDGRVDRRFARRASLRRRRGWIFAPAAMVGLAATVAAVVVLSSGGSGSFSSPTTSAAERAPAATATSSGTAASSAGASAAAPPSSAAAGAGAPQSLQPPSNGRKVIQSANLNLAVSPSRIDAVAQQVFDVIGAQKGIVDRSTVTATGGSDGYAEFQLSVPSSNLSQTMSQLSRLRGANVVSRTDATQDINGRFVSAGRQLADARALRTALLKQLAGAHTTSQINSLTAQIHDAETSIASDQAALRTLNRQVDYSQITVTINAAAVVAVAHGGSSFSIGKAAHDAGRVLTVAAGVGLIVLAALVPLALVVALAWWIAAAIRRRRREQALELA
jgi:hypothetical protein